MLHGKILVLSNGHERGDIQLALQKLGFTISASGERPSALVATAADSDGARLSNVIRLHERTNKVPLLLAVDVAKAGFNLNQMGLRRALQGMQYKIETANDSSSRNRWPSSSGRYFRSFKRRALAGDE